MVPHTQKLVSQACHMYSITYMYVPLAPPIRNICLTHKTTQKYVGIDVNRMPSFSSNKTINKFSDTKKTGYYFVL